MNDQKQEIQILQLLFVYSQVVSYLEKYLKKKKKKEKVITSMISYIHDLLIAAFTNKFSAS